MARPTATNASTSAPVQARPGTVAVAPGAVAVDATAARVTGIGGVAAEVVLAPTRGVRVATVAALARVPAVATTLATTVIGSATPTGRAASASHVTARPTIRQVHPVLEAEVGTRPAGRSSVTATPAAGEGP